jgi:hypothetical protein
MLGNHPECHGYPERPARHGRAAPAPASRARVNELNSRPIAPPPYRGKLTDISAEMGVLRTAGSRHPSFVSWNFRKSHGIDAKTCVSVGNECDDAGRR